MAGERERRMGENEAIFRAANERMANWEERDRVERALGGKHAGAHREVNAFEAQ